MELNRKKCKGAKDIVHKGITAKQLEDLGFKSPKGTNGKYYTVYKDANKNIQIEYWNGGLFIEEDEYGNSTDHVMLFDRTKAGRRISFREVQMFINLIKTGYGVGKKGVQKT
jgi:hypothetical protein